MKRIDKKSVRLRQLAYEEIRSTIIEGRLKPNQPLLEVDLSNQLGVSRTPLREALALLEHEGLIETIPYKGTFVAMVDKRTVEEILDLRILLECRAVELAAGKIPEERLLRLEGEIKQSINAESVLAALAIGNKLHHTIAQCCGNKTIEKLIVTYLERIHQYWAIHNISFSPQHLEMEIAEHVDIIDSLIEVNTEQAKLNMKTHLINSYHRTSVYIED